MVVDVALSLTVHQPRRVKLPAQPIPRCASIEDMTRCLFDARLNEQVFREVAQAYADTIRLFLGLVRYQGLRLALGISLAFVQQAALWEPTLLDLCRELAAEEAVEVIGMDPYRSLHCLLDLPAFSVRMQWMAEELARLFGKRPSVCNTIGLGISRSLYHALDAAGFCGALIEGSPQVMQWRSSNYVYRLGEDDICVAERKLPPLARRGTAEIFTQGHVGPSYTVGDPCDHAPYLLVRHEALNADLNISFTRHAQDGHPLYADTYARWLTHVEGDCVLLSCDLASLGAHWSNGLGAFLQALPDELAKQGLTMRTPSELIARFSTDRAYVLPLPKHSATLASFVNPDLYCEHEEQRVIVQAMNDVYHLAKLTEHPDLLDLALWLAQADNLHLLQWPGPQLVTAATPRKWWHLGTTGVLHEQRQVYNNALYAFEAYLPTRVLRQKSRQERESMAAQTSTPV